MSDIKHGHPTFDEGWRAASHGWPLFTGHTEAYRKGWIAYMESIK